MGTIQNSINGGLATIAGAATAAKHITEQKKMRELSEDMAAINAAENVTKTVDTAEKLGADYDEHKKLQDSFKADVKKLDKQFDDLSVNGSPESRLATAIGGKEAGEEVLNKQKDEIMRKRMSAHYNVELLQKSLDSLAVERDAKRLQAEIYKNQINTVGKRGKDMGTYKLPWEKENS